MTSKLCRGSQTIVLGPLLSLLYVIDIHQCSAKRAFNLFADDTNKLFAEKKKASFCNSSQY